MKTWDHDARARRWRRQGGGGGELVQMSFTDMMEEAATTAAVAQVDKGKGPDDWGSDFDSDSDDENTADRGLDLALSRRVDSRR